MDALADTRWAWVDAECIDGPLELGAIGLERELRVVRTEAALLFVYDDTLAVRGCTRTSFVRLEPAAGGHVRFMPEVSITLPVDAKCGAAEAEPRGGVVRPWGDMLEVLVERSAWCRGLDARFTYRKLPPATLPPAQLVRHYVAHFNRRDAAATAALFAERGELIEPFSPSADGNLRRHVGRDAVRAWYEHAFASTEWLALQLTDLQPLGPQLAAQWTYMDAGLVQPFAGRNLFVIAEGEIFQSEIQLLQAPIAIGEGRADPASHAP